MRKIIGMGETILDILFKERQPMAAVPGGSSFNAIISVGRAGVPCFFVGAAGNDEVGRIIMDFMHANGVSCRYFERSEEKSAVSLAFLDEAGDAHYSFYKPAVQSSGVREVPDFSRDDVLLYGSYFACCTPMRGFVEPVLDAASRSGCIRYYDLNFRKPHIHELPQLLPVIQSNMCKSSVVRGSLDDFEVMFGLRDAEAIYHQHIESYCKVFLCTSGQGDVVVCSPQGVWHFPVQPIHDVVSTVGAGDNFNAGVSCAFLWLGITLQDIPSLTQAEWGRIVKIATSFSAAACRSTENYVPVGFNIGQSSLWQFPVEK